MNYGGPAPLYMELTSMAILAWSRGTGIDRHYIQPG